MPQLITEVFMFIAQEGEGEGIPAVQLGDVLMPLLGADRARVDSLRRLAQQVADREGRPLTLARFTVREDLETLTPQDAP